MKQEQGIENLLELQAKIFFYEVLEGEQNGRFTKD